MKNNIMTDLKKIECTMHNYRDKVIVYAPNEHVAEVIAIGKYAEEYGIVSSVEAFKRIREEE